MPKLQGTSLVKIFLVVEVQAIPFLQCLPAVCFHKVSKPESILLIVLKCQLNEES